MSDAILVPTDGSAVAEEAVAHAVDLVAIGSHGRSGVRRAPLGSTTERVLRSTHAPVPVVDHGE